MDDLKERKLEKLKAKKGIDRQPDCQFDSELNIYLYNGYLLRIDTCYFGDLVDDKPCFMIIAHDSEDIIYRLVFFRQSSIVSSQLYNLEKPDIIIYGVG